MNKKLKRLSIELSSLNKEIKNLSNVKYNIKGYKELSNKLKTYIPKLSDNKGEIEIRFHYRGQDDLVFGTMIITKEVGGRFHIIYYFDSEDHDYYFKSEKDLLDYIYRQFNSYHDDESRGGINFVFEFKD